ncbi:MAG TPA: hypothetical protein VFC86_08345 [Planctomycetota bacterium]|nr:hypothetical protein [Planctomycetota bacterium]
MRALAVVAVAVLSVTAQAQEDHAPGAVQKVRDKLASLKITLDFTNARLDEVVAYFQEYSGLNFHLDPDVRTKEGEDGSRVTIKLKDVTMKSALKLILNPRELGCIYKDGVIVIAPKAKLGALTTTRVYDVRDLLFRLRDFAGPRVELTVPGGAGAALAGASFTLEEEPKGEITEEFLTDLIKTNTGDRSWDDSTNASITQINGLLVISQSKPVHDEIRRLLDLLRQFK